ncbi:MAG: SsrA-binding protein SmpB [Rhizobiales bacterium TMED168]|nr:MAG: SsrA-binding protein SmpB [Rhizobiales bacterium TMED168]|tara:strand:+ start:6760 stop:7251 length:492 start_codon:yes stop_codon:yes gene_type:complete
MSSKSGGSKKNMKGEKIIADNRKANYLFTIEDVFEAGIVLKGSEVKSLRLNRVNISESYASEEGGEIYLINSNIPAYKNAIFSNHKPKRKRKLLLHSREINKLKNASQKKGMTLIPIKLFFNEKGIAKISIGVGKGKKLHDKRQDEKRKDWDKQKSRLLKNSN